MKIHKIFRISQNVFRTDSSILDAASNGASQVIFLILNIIANLVSFIAVVGFADGILKWLTTLVGFEDIGIQFVLGKAFIPLSWAIGVDWKDCEAVGNIIGTKTIINEFVAYQLLGKYKKAGEISVRNSNKTKISRKAYGGTTYFFGFWNPPPP